MSTVWFIPISLLLGAAVFTALINRGRPNIGAAWFASILAALFTWGWTISLYWRFDFISADTFFSSRDMPLFTRIFSGIGASGIVPVLILDRISYPYMLAVSALLVVLLLTAPSYMEPQSAPRLWFFYLLIEAIGYLTVSTNDLSFIIYGWVIFDGIDLVTQYLQARPGMIRRNFLTAIGIRFLGTILAAATLAYSTAVSPGKEFFIAPSAGGFLLIACALRMGILPISQPYSEVSSSRVGLGTMLRLVSVLTVMPVLSRIPLMEMSLQGLNLLSVVGGFASLTGAVGWLLSENASSGNTYAVLSICGMAFVSALSREPSALIAWGISVVLTCGPLSLYQIHNPFMNVLAGLLVAAFSGLPYTPNAAGWSGLVRAPYSLKDLLFILVMIILMGGAFLHILRAEGRKFSELEPWMRSVYPLGFIVSMATHIFIFVIGFEKQYAMGVPAASITSFAGAVILAVLMHRLPERFRTQNLVAWGRESVSFFWRVMKQLLDMDWLIRFGTWITRIVRSVASEISSVLENNGGLVWELLLMALLVAVAYSGAWL